MHFNSYCEPRSLTSIYTMAFPSISDTSSMYPIGRYNVDAPEDSIAGACQLFPVFAVVDIPPKVCGMFGAVELRKLTENRRLTSS